MRRERIGAKTTVISRAAGLILVAGTVTTACTTAVIGDGSAAPTNVREYHSEVVSSLARAKSDACNTFQTNRGVRQKATAAMNIAWNTRTNETWDWRRNAGLVSGAEGALRTETGQVDTIVKTSSNEELKNRLVTYKDALTQYADGLVTDRTAGVTVGRASAVLPKSLAGQQATTAASKALDSVCP